MRLSIAVLIFVCLIAVGCSTTGIQSTVAAAGSNAPSNGAPPAGDYVCSMVVKGWNGFMHSENKGLLTLIDASTYKYRNGNDRGTYTFDPATKKMKFKTGAFQDASGTFIASDKVWQIDVDFATKSPMRWHCALPKK